jgi:hypothetical protein
LFSSPTPDLCIKIALHIGQVPRRMIPLTSVTLINFGFHMTTVSHRSPRRATLWKFKLHHYLLVGSGSVLAQIGRVCDDYHDANVRKLKVRN